MYFFRDTIVIILFFSLLFYGVMCSENKEQMPEAPLETICKKATLKGETEDNLSQSIADNSSPNIDTTKQTRSGVGSKSDSTESLSEPSENAWTVILLIFLLGVLVIKVILSQAEIKRLSSLVDRLSSKVTDIDKSTWGKLASSLEKINSEASSGTKQPTPVIQTQSISSDALPLSVFAEIERMEARLTKYDESDKNRKPMMKALERLEETLSELGYEREKLVGAKYVEGKNYEVRFIPSKDPSHKTPTITRVYKSSILLGGKIIQPGGVEVSEFRE